MHTWIKAAPQGNCTGKDPVVGTVVGGGDSRVMKNNLRVKVKVVSRSVMDPKSGSEVGTVRLYLPPVDKLVSA